MMSTAPHQHSDQPAGCRVTIHGPDGTREYQLATASDNAIVIEIDGMPLVGVDHTGAGWWPDPNEPWTRIRTSGTQTARTITITGITTEAMWRDLEAHLGLPRYGLGRWKEWAADRPTILGASYDLNAAADWAIRNNLPYDDERSTHYEPTTSPAAASPPPAHQTPDAETAARTETDQAAAARHEAETWAYAIGDDHIVVSGVVYDADEWEHDGEGGVQPRRSRDT